MFHIVTTNPSQVTDAQIQDQLNVLNADFAGLNADSTGIPVYFKSLFGNLASVFAWRSENPLAKRQRELNGRPQQNLLSAISTT